MKLESPKALIYLQSMLYILLVQSMTVMKCLSLSWPRHTGKACICSMKRKGLSCACTEMLTISFPFLHHHRNSLDLASEKGIESIAFPAISCGVFGYPIKKAAKVAVQECIDFSERVSQNSAR